ncbi:penicillin-binding transpeptidase domain-containing protein [Dactylosporangium sp. NPDC050588]|uniref:penicillin-binding transpeptidase domain-containing protein n=1 Tax=Dactylosporangium sp. NPDC050588 TaxID=3157211 RepID=UPI0033D8CEB6
MVDGPASNLLVLAGLVWAVVLTARLLFGGGPVLDRWTWRCWAPHALVAAGFGLSRATVITWLALICCGVVLATVLALRVSRPGVPGRTAVAVVLATGVLLELGALLTVRLTVAPDPARPALSAASLAYGLDIVLLPMLAAAGIAVAVPALRGPAAQRVLRPLVASASSPQGRTLTAALLILVPIAAEQVLSEGGAGRLPQWQAPVLLLGIAWLVAPSTPRPQQPAARRRRLLVLAGLLVLAVAVLIVGHHGASTLAAVGAGTVGIVVVAGRRATPVPGPRRNPVASAIRRHRAAVGAGCGMLLLTFAAAVAAGPVTADRLRMWEDPWAHRWSSECLQVDGVGTPQLPAGWTPCQRSLAADLESYRSQTAIGLAAIADGGLWGRGLTDTVSGSVPAGATDLVLAVEWSKLGGLVVLAGGILTVLLGVATARVGGQGQTRDGPGAARLFASGVGAMLAGQYLLAFAGTVNLVPLLGVSTPFLSRATQANVALVVAVIAVLAVRGSRPASGPGSPSPQPQAVLTGGGRSPALVAAVSLTLTAVAVTAMPYLAPHPDPAGLLPAVYGESRPPCPPRPATREGLTSPPPDPVACSTDLIAQRRTRIEVRLGDGTALVLQQDGTWRQEGGAGRLDQADLTGLLRTRRGSATGILERSYPEVVSGTAGSSLRRRLLPQFATGADGRLDITVDPDLQHAAAQALRSSGPAGSGPLAGGVVAIDARTGRLLVLASAPPQPAAQSTTVTQDPYATEGRWYYDTLQPDGRLDGTRPNTECTTRSAGTAECWRWSYGRAASRDEDTAGDQLRQYVGGRTDVTVPAPTVNRAAGAPYGLGDTFKVVVAAAYLQQAGAGADDLIDAPDQVTLPSSVTVRNPGGGPCRRSAAGKVTVRDALAGRCNTAFVLLAQRLGWQRIAQQSERFGLRVGPCGGTTAWLDGPAAGTVGSCVPASTDPTGVALNVLGGAGVEGTPLGMATVMAAIANDGSAIRPTLVTADKRPGAAAVAAAPSERRTALSTGVATELRRALSGATGDGMTVDGLDAAVGAPVWALAGGHDLVSPSPQQFGRHIAWLSGFVETSRGPVAFAVAVECNEPAAGARQARHIVETLILSALARR